MLNIKCTKHIGTVTLTLEFNDVKAYSYLEGFKSLDAKMSEIIRSDVKPDKTIIILTPIKGSDNDNIIKYPTNKGPSPR